MTHNIRMNSEDKPKQGEGMPPSSIQSKHPIMEPGFKLRMKEAGKHIKDMFVTPTLLKELTRLRKEGHDYIIPLSVFYNWPYAMDVFNDAKGNLVIKVGSAFGEASHITDLNKRIREKFLTVGVSTTLRCDVILNKTGESRDFDEAVEFLNRRKKRHEYIDPIL